jgi:hypothetical protein
MFRPPLEAIVTAVCGSPATRAAWDVWYDYYRDLLRRYVSL